MLNMLLSIDIIQVSFRFFDSFHRSQITVTNVACILVPFFTHWNALSRFLSM